MILMLDEKYQKNSSVILKDESQVIDFTQASKLPYEIITKNLNIPNNDQTYDNWYSIMNESYYFKNRTQLQTIITELLGVYLSKYMELDTVEYELAVLNGELIGLLSQNFRRKNTKYIYASKLTKKDRKNISHYLIKDSLLSLEYKKELYNYIMRLYYAAAFDLSSNVLCEKIGTIPYLSTLFDYEKSFIDSEYDSIYDPFTNSYISSKSIRAILENNLLIKQSIDHILGFDITEALKSIEEEYNVSIPSEVKEQYQEFDSSRKNFIEDKLYQRSLY